MTRVLIACRQMQGCFDQFRPRLDALGIESVLPEVVQQMSEDDLLPIIGEFDGMIAGDDILTARVLGAATQMRIISKWGIGTDAIDLEAARRLGIPVTNTPAVFGDDVADVAAGYLVMLARRLHLIDRSIRDGGWLKYRGLALNSATLAVYGLGSIGRAVARRGQGFGMTVVGYDVAEESQAGAAAMGVEVLGTAAEMFARADFLVLCMPATAQTRHAVNAETLALMPAGAFLINVSRGTLVDESALVDALSSGHLAGVALDVFELEPLPAESPLRRFESAIFGSHNGSNTEEGVLRASAVAVNNLVKGLEVGSARGEPV
jgi:D-3-phosphoglycerate dehydrogenase / 2-oxoglutarate reductase